MVHARGPTEERLVARPSVVVVVRASFINRRRRCEECLSNMCFSFGFVNTDTTRRCDLRKDFDFPTGGYSRNTVHTPSSQPPLFPSEHIRTVLNDFVRRLSVCIFDIDKSSPFSIGTGTVSNFFICSRTSIFLFA